MDKIYNCPIKMGEVDNERNYIIVLNKRGISWLCSSDMGGISNAYIILMVNLEESS
jgi:hypothetical protein